MCFPGVQISPALLAVLLGVCMYMIFTSRTRVVAFLEITKLTLLGYCRQFDFHREIRNHIDEVTQIGIVKYRTGQENSGPSATRPAEIVPAPQRICPHTWAVQPTYSALASSDSGSHLQQ